MDKKIELILLVDDDQHDNFFHKKVIEKAGVSLDVQVVKNGLEAITFLESAADKGFPTPELIFLDINMPRMNGWEFIEAYEQLEKEQQAKIVIVMLTTSLNPEEKEKAETSPTVNDFRSKPLTVEMLHEIMDTHFS